MKSDEENNETILEQFRHTKAKIEYFIAKGKLTQAVISLSTFPKTFDDDIREEAILIKMEFNTLKRSKRVAPVSLEEELKIRRSLSKRILELIKEVEDALSLKQSLEGIGVKQKYS